MATSVIRIKRSTVAGKVPSADSLEFGEFAANLADHLLYWKDATGVLRSTAISQEKNEKWLEELCDSDINSDSWHPIQNKVFATGLNNILNDLKD